MLEKQKQEDKIPLFGEDVNENNVKTLIEKIRTINAKDDTWYNEAISILPAYKNIITREGSVLPICLSLSTFGGSVYDGLGLYDIIESSKTPVQIECAGKIMSMGIIIMLAAKERLAHKNTTFMIHTISSMAFGQLKSLEDNVEESKRLNEILFNIIANKTKITRDKLNDIYEHKQDWFLTTKDALDLGLITKII